VSVRRARDRLACVEIVVDPRPYSQRHGDSLHRL
jgi:hypothetical protein